MKKFNNFDVKIGEELWGRCAVIYKGKGIMQYPRTFLKFAWVHKPDVEFLVRVSFTWDGWKINDDESITFTNQETVEKFFNSFEMVQTLTFKNMIEQADIETIKKYHINLTDDLKIAESLKRGYE